MGKGLIVVTTFSIGEICGREQSRVMVEKSREICGREDSRVRVYGKVKYESR